MVTEAITYGKGSFVVEVGTVVVNPLLILYREENRGNVELLGEHRAEDDQAECLADHILVDCWMGAEKWSDHRGGVLLFYLL